MHIDPKLHSNCVCPFMFDVSSIAAMGFSGSDILFPGYYLLKMSSIYICSIACVLQCTADRYKAIIERNLFECKNSIVYERKKRNNNSKHMNEWNMLKIHIHVHNLIFILLINLMCSTKRVLRYCFFFVRECPSYDYIIRFVYVYVYTKRFIFTFRIIEQHRIWAKHSTWYCDSIPNGPSIFIRNVRSRSLEWG